MIFSDVRGRNLSWGCDDCGAGYGPTPGFKWYWCVQESGGCDYCPKCYPNRMKVLVKKGYEASNPTTFDL